MSQALLPEVVMTGEFREILLDKLPPNAELVGDEPSSELVKSIEAYGVLEAIIVEERASVRDNPGGYSVSGGRRRIKACRKLGLDRIPARVYPEGWANVHSTTITLNSSRRQNIVADLVAIKSLLEQGHTEKEIATALGINLGTLQSRTKLLGLIPELVSALLDGRIKPSVAESAVALCKSDQKKLAAKLGEGVVGAKEVSEIRQVAKSDAKESIKPLAGLGQIAPPPNVQTVKSADAEPDPEPLEMTGQASPVQPTPVPAQPKIDPKVEKLFKALEKKVWVLEQGTKGSDNPEDVMTPAQVLSKAGEVVKAFDAYRKAR